jgi:hypothetical protein
MSRLANPWDNAKCESFMKTLKHEEIRANEYRDLEHLRKNVMEFVEHYYNGHRLHSALGYRTPEDFEQNITPARADENWGFEFFKAWRDLSIRCINEEEAARRRLPEPSS